jgi:two-component system sensor histidine kinase YesM
MRLHTSIALAFSCLILCMTAIVSYNAYRLSEDAVAENSYEYTSELIQQVSQNIETYISNMESISTLSLFNEDISKFLRMPDANDPERVLLQNQIRVFFDSVIHSRTDIASMVLVGYNGSVVSSSDNHKLKPVQDLASQDWYKRAQVASGQIVISTSHVQHIYRGEYRWVVSISRQVHTNAPDYQNGILLIDFNYNVIEQLLQSIDLGGKGYVFLVGPEGDLIYHHEQQLIYSGLKTEDFAAIMAASDGAVESGEGDQRKMYAISTTPFGWKVVGVTYPEELVSNKKDMQQSAALWGLLFVLIAIVISIILALTLTRPVKRLEASMKLVEKGNFDVRAKIESTNEIGKLARTFNLMIAKIRELMDQIVYEQEKKRTSELKALQAQIHPHFLYNTLDSIIWMAEIGKVKEVVKMTSALSKLLRASISRGEELVPIASELEHVDSYLTIQQMRYKDKFTYEIDVDPDLQAYKILRVVLQPLVENAVYHGMKQLAEIGHIQITGKRYGDIIELKVIDNGVGMDQETVQSLLAGQTLPSSSNGMGVQNVHDRLQLYFGDAYGLTFASELEEGTTVTIRIPAILEDSLTIGQEDS